MSVTTGAEMMFAWEVIKQGEIGKARDLHGRGFPLMCYWKYPNSFWTRLLNNSNKVID